MKGTVTESARATVEVAVNEVVELVSALIRFDTTNTGDPHTTRGEAECAQWVAGQLREVGYSPEYLESGAPGRGNVVVRLPGADPSRGALLIHGHLDVVPAEPQDWSVHPFSGAVSDGYVWGRGAVSMRYSRRSPPSRRGTVTENPPTSPIASLTPSKRSGRCSTSQCAP
ncbi:MAG: M20/M25/M40 family metallo-hydrolase, partial [Mycobacterium sp.]